MEDGNSIFFFCDPFEIGAQRVQCSNNLKLKNRRQDKKERPFPLSTLEQHTGTRECDEGNKKWTRPVVIDCLALYFFLSISPACRIPSHPIFLWQTFFFLQRDRGKKHTHIHSLLCFFILLSLFSSRRIIRSVSIPFRGKRRGWKFICLFFYWSVCYSSVSLFFSFSFVCVKPNAQLFRFVFFYCFFFVRVFLSFNFPRPSRRDKTLWHGHT